MAQPTVAGNKRHGSGFWIGITLACIVGVSGLTLGAFFLYFLFTGEDETANQNPNKKAVAVKTSENTKSSPQPTPSPEKDRDVAKLSDRIVAREIDWTTTALSYKTDVPARLAISCPPDGIESTVYGSETYASNSSICTAAVHAGKITFENGGRVAIVLGPGLSSYVTTTQNGVTTNKFGDESSSFEFD